jgi:hypothetical protein
MEAQRLSREELQVSTIGVDGCSFNFLHNGEDSVTKLLCGRMAIGRDCFDLVSGTPATLPGLAQEICGRWAWVRNTVIREYLTISARYVDLRSTYSNWDAREPRDKKPIQVRRAVSLSGGSITERRAAVPGDIAPPTRILSP